MKYKVGDHVRIKSMSWWNENCNELSSVCIKTFPYNFPEEMANRCCGKVGEIKNSNSGCYGITYLDKHYWFTEDWIERKVERIDIHLKYMKSEI